MNYALWTMNYELNQIMHYKTNLYLVAKLHHFSQNSKQNACFYIIICVKTNFATKELNLICNMQAIQLFKSRNFKIAWKAILWVTEVHSRRRRECTRIKGYRHPYQPGRLYIIATLYMTFRDVLPSRQYNNYGFNPPHILVSLACTGLLIVLSSRQFWICE